MISWINWKQINKTKFNAITTFNNCNNKYYCTLIITEINCTSNWTGLCDFVCDFWLTCRITGNLLLFRAVDFDNIKLLTTLSNKEQIERMERGLLWRLTAKNETLSYSCGYESKAAAVRQKCSKFF